MLAATRDGGHSAGPESTYRVRKPIADRPSDGDSAVWPCESTAITAVTRHFDRPASRFELRAIGRCERGGKRWAGRDNPCEGEFGPVLRGVGSQHSGCRSRMTAVAAAVAIALLCALSLACGARPRGDDAVASAACTRTRYLLTVRPDTTVSNEWHSLEIHGTASACGRRSPVPGAGVRLGRYRATTKADGRASLTVRLETGRYVIRLYVHRQPVARVRVWVIPNVSR